MAIMPSELLATSMHAKPALLAFLVLPMACASVAQAAPRCEFLQPIGGNGTTPIVAKRVGPGSLIGKPNWNTDFIVARPYGSYRFYFTANSSDPAARYPVQGYMKFSDGSNLSLFSESINPPIGQGKMYGPYPAVPGKMASQMNFKIGASNDPGAEGFSYRISVQGCY
jgi:hypothetical protein